MAKSNLFAVNGYGVIEMRVADAVAKQDDMQFAGVWMQLRTDDRRWRRSPACRTLERHRHMRKMPGAGLEGSVEPQPGGKCKPMQPSSAPDVEGEAGVRQRRSDGNCDWRAWGSHAGDRRPKGAGGEIVRFVPVNKGQVLHEMVLGTMDDLKKHAELMRKHPGMEHDEPHMAHVAPGRSSKMGWQFTKTDEFFYGCLIPGRFEAGMIGKVKVTQ